MKRNTLFIIVTGLLVGMLSVICMRIVGAKFIRETTQEVSVSVATSTQAKIDYPAPDFLLPDREGKNVSLTALRGDPVILTFFAGWDQASLDQLRIFEEYQLPESVIIYAVNQQEDADTTKVLLERAGYRVPALFDINGAVSGRFGVHNLPTTFFIDRFGNIRASAIGLLSKDAISEYLHEIFIE